jgi:hypothetical protein
MATRSWASLVGEDDDIDEEVLAPMTPPAMKSPADPCKGIEADASSGWREVLPRRSPRCSSSPSAALPLRLIPACSPVDVADVLLTGIVRLYAEILFGALVAWRMATARENAAILGVLLAHWHALLHRQCLATTSRIVVVQL